MWHFRCTVRAYLKQQMGYGKAEALLFFKHLLHFNLLDSRAGSAASTATSRRRSSRAVR
ncbi:MAG: hypothetical protein U1E86_28740 [Burkholderiaceae bacterium]